MIQIKKLNTQDSNFTDQLSQLIFFEAEENTQIEKTVAEILSDVKKRGDQAVIEYTKKFDHVDFSRMEEFEISFSSQKNLKLLHGFFQTLDHFLLILHHHFIFSFNIS